MKQMPRIDSDKVSSPFAKRLVPLITTSEGTLRTTRPDILPDFPLSGHAAYVWRMIAFHISPISQHHCLPMAAPFYIQEEDIHKLVEFLDTIVDEILEQFPPSSWQGIMAWGRVF